MEQTSTFNRVSSLRTRISLIFVLTLMSCLSLLGQTYITQDILTSTTWPLAGSPYIIQSSISILNSSTLTIASGVTVSLTPGGINVSSGSTLVAGSVTFKSISLANAGVGSITCSGNLNLQHSLFDTTSVTLSGGGSQTLQNNTFRTLDGWYPITFSGLLPQPAITGNTFLGTSAILLDQNAYAEGSLTLARLQNLPYYSQWSIYVGGNFGANPGSLTIAKGVTVFCIPGAIYVYSGSTLIADSVTFKSISLANAGVGSITCSGNLNLQHSLFDTTSVTLSGNATGAINYSDFFVPSSEYAISNTSPTTIDARFNFWGDSTGPYHPTLNPNGKGAWVSDNVNFIPFASTPFHHADSMICIFIGNWDQSSNAGTSRNLAFYVDKLIASPHTRTIIPTIFDSQSGIQIAVSPSSRTITTGSTSEGFTFIIPSDSNRLFGRITVNVTDSLGTQLSRTQFDFKYYLSDFTYKRHNYSFENTLDINKTLREAMLLKLLQEFWSLNSRWGPYVTAGYFIKAFFGMGGLCYGMSSTSIRYKENPELLPSPYTFAYEVPPSNTQVSNAIFNQQMQQIPYLFEYLTPSIFYNPKEHVEKLLDSLQHNKAQIMMIHNHAVAAYALLDRSDSMVVYYYNPNYLNIPANLAVLRNANLPSPKFFFEGEETRVLFTTPSMLGTSPQSTIAEPRISRAASTSLDTNQIADLTLRYMRENGKQFFMFRDSTFNNDTLNSVNILLHNSAGQRIGFINGIQINEVPGGVIFDAEHYKLFEVPSGDIYTTEARGSHSGDFTASFLILNSDSTARLIYYPPMFVQSLSIATASVSQNSTSIPFLIDTNGDGTPDTTVTPVYSAPIVTGIKDLRSLPTQFELFQNYPNPFNPSTSIEFALAQKSRVVLEVFNILGQRVSTLVDQFMSPGYYTQTFNAVGLASGIYFYQLRAGDLVQTKKLLLLR